MATLLKRIISSSACSSASSLPQPSRIKISIGRALDELIYGPLSLSLGYPANVVQDGYKIVLWPGEDMLSSLCPLSPKLQPVARDVRALASTYPSGRSRTAKA